MQPAGCFHSRSGVRLNHELALARSDEDANSSPRTAAWFPPALIYPKKRGVRYNVEFAKMLFSTSRKMAFIGWGSSGNGSSNNEAISIRLFAGVTRARSSPPYNRNTSSDAFRKSSPETSPNPNPDWFLPRNFVWSSHALPFRTSFRDLTESGRPATRKADGCRWYSWRPQAHCVQTAGIPASPLSRESLPEAVSEGGSFPCLYKIAVPQSACLGPYCHFTSCRMLALAVRITNNARLQD